MGPFATPHDVDGPLMSGTGWWSRTVRDCLSRHRSRLPVKPMMPFTVDCLCAGSAGEIAGLEALGVPVIVLAFSDKKSASRKWLKGAFCLGKHDGPHIFDDNNALLDADGCRFRCYGKGHTKCSLSLDERPFCTIAGLPCMPFSNQIYKGGNAAATGSVSGPPQFKCVCVCVCV